MFSKLSLWAAVMDLELPIHRLTASGDFWRAMRAKGMSFWASGKRVKYSSRRLSFSIKRCLQYAGGDRDSEGLLTGLRISHLRAGGELWVGLLARDVCEEFIERLGLFMRFCKHSRAVFGRERGRVGVSGDMESAPEREQPVPGGGESKCIPTRSDSNVDRLALKSRPEV